MHQRPLQQPIPRHNARLNLNSRFKVVKTKIDNKHRSKQRSLAIHPRPFSSSTLHPVTAQSNYFASKQSNHALNDFQKYPTENDVVVDLLAPFWQHFIPHAKVIVEKKTIGTLSKPYTHFGLAQSIDYRFPLRLIVDQRASGEISENINPQFSSLSNSLNNVLTWEADHATFSPYDLFNIIVTPPYIPVQNTCTNSKYPCDIPLFTQTPNSQTSIHRLFPSPFLSFLRLKLVINANRSEGTIYTDNPYGLSPDNTSEVVSFSLPDQLIEMSSHMLQILETSFSLPSPTPAPLSHTKRTMIIPDCCIVKPFSFGSKEVAENRLKTFQYLSKLSQNLDLFHGNKTTVTEIHETTVVTPITEHVEYSFITKFPYIPGDSIQNAHPGLKDYPSPSAFHSLLRQLQELHLANITHGDVRPHNIVYSPIEDKLTLIDFDLVTFKDAVCPYFVHYKLSKTRNFQAFLHCYDAEHRIHPFIPKSITNDNTAMSGTRIFELTRCYDLVCFIHTFFRRIPPDLDEKLLKVMQFIADSLPSNQEYQGWDEIFDLIATKYHEDIATIPKLS